MANTNKEKDSFDYNIISLQSGLRQYTQNLQPYTGMLGGLTPDVHTLRALNPLTTNRVICVMYRVPWFLLQYFGGRNGNAYSDYSPLMTYKKCLEYFNQGITCQLGDGALTPATYQGGFAGRTIALPTTQNTQGNQTLQINVTEMVGRPIATVHNMWVDGISDPITGLTHYQGQVAGSFNKSTHMYERVFEPNENQNSQAFEPSPAYEVAEFLVMALDRSGARCEAAALALGCYPQAKLNGQILSSNATGSSQLEQYQITFNCQFVQSTFVNDIANRYVKQFAIFGNSMNLNPGVGDAFFNTTSSDSIDTPLMHNGNRPTLDAVQSGMGNAPVYQATATPIKRDKIAQQDIMPFHHSEIQGYDNNGVLQHNEFDEPSEFRAATTTGNTTATVNP